MSSYYSGSGVVYSQMDMAFGAPSLPKTPVPDKWKQCRGPLDPTSSPSSSFSPTLSPASSPKSPRDSPTITRQLHKFGELALGNGISPQPTQAGSSLHQSLLDGRNNTSCVDNFQPVLGPSFTRRSPAFSTDNLSAPGHTPTVVPTVPHHLSTVRPDKSALGYPISLRSQGNNRHSTPHVLPIPMPPEDRRPFDLYGLGGIPPGFDFGLEFFDELKATPADIANSAGASTANVGLSTENDQFAVGFPIHPLPVPQFGSDFFPFTLTEPHEEPPDYSQQPPAEPLAGGSGSKHSDSMTKVLKYYYENFKHSQPILRVCDQQFRAQVGSFKTSQASLRKRRDEGQWTCPLECKDFTRKQNLKLHIQSHLGIKDCECICGSKFNAHSGLKRHQKKCRNFLSSSD